LRGLRWVLFVLSVGLLVMPDNKMNLYRKACQQGSSSFVLDVRPFSLSELPILDLVDVRKYLNDMYKLS